MVYSFQSTCFILPWLNLFLYILFWCNCKWNCFLISLSDILLVVYRNVTDICILYPVNLLNASTSSNSFEQRHIWNFNLASCHANSGSFTSSFLIWIPFIFLVLLMWPGIPILCWIKVVRVGILVLFLILEEILSAFHHWVWCWLWVCHKWPLLCWAMFFLYLFGW